MITSLFITNFQGHKISNLNLCSNVNCIIGQTDAGKSSIIRDLKLVLLNRPAGTSFLPLSNKKAKTDTIVNFEDGKWIQRIRGKTDNIYKTEGLEFEKFGTEPPDEIQKVINIISWLNFQFQKDPDFLISMSGGDAAKALNTIIRMEIIDETIQGIRQDEREANKAFKAIESEYEQVETELKSLDWVEKANAKIKHLEIFERDLKALEKELIEIKSLESDLQSIDEKIAAIKPIPIKAVNELEDEVGKLGKLENELNELNRLNTNLISIENQIASFKTIPIEKVINLEELLDNIKSGEEKLKELNRLLVQLNTLEVSITNESKLLAELKKEFDQIKPDECPTCEQIVKEWKL